MPTFWEILTAVAPILAPVVSLVLVVIGRIIWRHEQRLRDLEQQSTRQRRTLYGDEDDDRQKGLSTDLRELIRRVETLEQTVARIERFISQRSGYSNEDDD